VLEEEKAKDDEGAEEEEQAREKGLLNLFGG